MHSHLSLSETILVGVGLEKGPYVMVTHFCDLMFSIDPFHGTVRCDVDPLDCADLLSEISYQEQIHAIYQAHQQQYHID